MVVIHILTLRVAPAVEDTVVKPEATIATIAANLAINQPSAPRKGRLEVAEEVVVNVSIAAN